VSWFAHFHSAKKNWQGGAPHREAGGASRGGSLAALLSRLIQEPSHSRPRDFQRIPALRSRRGRPQAGRVWQEDLARMRFARRPLRRHHQCRSGCRQLGARKTKGRPRVRFVEGGAASMMIVHTLDSSSVSPSSLPCGGDRSETMGHAPSQRRPYTAAFLGGRLGGDTPRDIALVV
jgi:hypothetical protein